MVNAPAIDTIVPSNLARVLSALQSNFSILHNQLPNQVNFTIAYSPISYYNCNLFTIIGFWKLIVFWIIIIIYYYLALSLYYKRACDLHKCPIHISFHNIRQLHVINFFLINTIWCKMFKQNEKYLEKGGKRYH